jgi:hypothetical protein
MIIHVEESLVPGPSGVSKGRRGNVVLPSSGMYGLSGWRFLYRCNHQIPKKEIA